MKRCLHLQNLTISRDYETIDCRDCGKSLTAARLLKIIFAKAHIFLPSELRAHDKEIRDKYAGR